MVCEIEAYLNSVIVFWGICFGSMIQSSEESEESQGSSEGGAGGGAFGVFSRSREGDLFWIHLD